MPQILSFLFILIFLEPTFANVSFQSNAEEGLFVCNAGIDQSKSSDQLGSSALVVEYDDLRTDPDSPARTRRMVRQTSLATPTIAAFESQAIWNQNIRKLEFNFSLEKYSARYFVDFCYLGPVQILNGSTDLTWGNYQIDIDSFFSGSNGYPLDSLLKVNTQVICDLRNQGLELNPRSTQELVPETLPIESDIHMLGDWQNSGSRTTSFSRGINQGKRDVPRFCYVRLSFNETNSSKSRNNANQSEVIVDLSISRN